MSKSSSTVIPGEVRIVVRHNIARCIIIPAPLSPSQMRIVHAAWPTFKCYPKLVTRWSVWGVLAEENWVSAMNHLGSLMTMPDSVSLHFASSHVS